MSIEVQALSKYYGKQKALDEISFEAKPGEILGFLGPNGAGKSTTMKILTGYIPASSGIARIAGMDVSGKNIDIRRKIGYLPELNPLYPDMFIKEYLLFVAQTYRLGSGASAAVEKAMTETGILPERTKKIGQLSKGYKQRVGLAAALLHDPEVLILDEPTSGLDPNQVTEIRQLIRRISQSKTVLFSTHIMQEVEALCSRVIIINKGKIVANDTLGDITRSNTNECIVTVQFKHTPDIALLQTIPSVYEVHSRGDFYIIQSSEDIRESLSVLASKNQWIVLSMQSESRSLEEIFQTLTRTNS